MTSPGGEGQQSHMRAAYRFTCGLRNGIHARPASMVSALARRFVAEMTIGKVGGVGVDARSVLSIVGLDVRLDDECEVVAVGEDSGQAVAAMRELVESRLADAEDSAEAAGLGDVTGGTRVPLGIKRLGVPTIPGRAVCGGVGEGVGVIVKGLSLSAELAAASAGAAHAEREAARRAVEAVRADLYRRSGLARGIEREMLLAHSAIADDPAFWCEVERGIGAGATAPQAVVAAAEKFSHSLRCAASLYIRDRALDVQDVATQMLSHLVGGGTASTAVTLDRESVVFAETLTPGQFMKLDRRFLRGLVLGRVGATSHTAILARSHRVPTLIDVDRPAAVVKPGEWAVVDGEGGFAISPVDARVSRYYLRERATLDRRAARIWLTAGGPATTGDGVALEIASNASDAEGVASAISAGADGIGLLRTEVLFLDRAAAPTEDEQYEAYAAIVRAAEGKPVLFRTFDIGGDKPAPYLSMPVEENPFLGVRGLRLYHRHRALLRSQLRALVRASVDQCVRIMAPMVTTAEEGAWFRARVRAAEAELAGEGVVLSGTIPVGVMIEVPAAGMVIDHLAKEVDFFSIGTNDLCQYWTAADRGNAGVAGLCNPREPSFLRFLASIVDQAKHAGRWIGLCGEMAGDPCNLPLMIGLGVDEISVAGGEVTKLKDLTGGCLANECRELLRRALTCRAASDVEDLLRRRAPRRAIEPPIISAELIEIESDAATKEEAIKEAVDLLFVSGRTDRPREVEEAVWAREDTYSTGLGHGFAVPHCKCEAVAGPALTALRLRSPVAWGSIDGGPVRMVILLTVPADEAAGGGGKGHMRVFATLARRLMHDAFRDSLLAAPDADAIGAILRLELGVE